MEEQDKINLILEYLSERSGELYDELSERGHDDPARSSLIDQITCFDEIYQRIKGIMSEK